LQVLAMLIDTLQSQRRLVEEYGLDEHAAEGVKEETDPRMDARIRRPEVRLYGVILAATSLLAALNFFT
jgi:hypothetical protein